MSAHLLGRLRARLLGRGDRGEIEGSADFAVGGLSLSLGGIVSFAVVHAVLGGPGNGEGAAQNTSFDASAVSGQCQGRQAATAEEYPNGQIPTEALCELHQEGEYLRADAAAGFLALNEAYEERFGSGICVTDAYRSLADQHRLYDAYQSGTGNLAAVPGTSNHGWGLAVDLCGGVNRFGTEQHEWMRANSQEFGWFHPAWAQQGSSSAEAWHWEYSVEGPEAVAA
ncbi:M15 family metallopeptidase [Streptomonospora litoralis]|uniref:D-alanyl-D-alanine carboxypeptidase n=1 Tax=Streptomonospora litoralis TaxID=2498135 RepID=A0A4P6Q7I9_9ACTN|nr:M15 family metallopeptidase [Streptomonospora litoralis]QBI56350.1 D-alanyl-D-alanine carboxypeptidase [Streptomonospora litoralis]